MSFKAELVVQGETYVVRRFNWGISQNTDTLSRPDARVQGGQLQVELDSQPDDMLHFWALDHNKKIKGELLIMEADSRAVRKTIKFEDAYCVGLRKQFDGSGSTQSMTMTLDLSAKKLTCGQVTIDNEWPT
jgi:hypothetical protein